MGSQSKGPKPIPGFGPFFSLRAAAVPGLAHGRIALFSVPTSGHVAPMSESDDDVMEARRWKKSGWIAQVIKNEDDDGWAVEMTRVGDSEPALTGPWTMGRDKKNPKPLDQGAFTTLVKTASEVLLRHEQSARARLHRSLVFTGDGGRRIRVDLDIAEDDDDPHAILAAVDVATGEQLASGRVAPSWKLTAASAERFLRSGEA
jgi:hypothetical protein